MIRFFSTVCIALAAAAMLMLGNLGYTYTFTTGYGLHPALAGIGILLMAWYIHTVISFAKWLRSSEKHYQAELDALQFVKHEDLTGKKPLGYMPDESMYCDGLETVETWK